MAEQEQPPTAGPNHESVATQAAWQELTAESLHSVRESASKWRDGLAALITLVTAGLVVSGPDKAGDLPPDWRWGVAGGLVLGMLLVLGGLLLMLAVAAGSPRALTLADFQKLSGDRVAVDALQATASAKRLRLARWLAVPGIILVLLAIGAWLVSPTKAASSVQVTTADAIYCGELSSGDGGVLRMDLEGESQTTAVKYAEVHNIAIVASCTAPRSPR